MRRSAEAGVYDRTAIRASVDYTLQTFDIAQHPADITLEWADCTSTAICDLEAGLLQPSIICDGGEIRHAQFRYRFGFLSLSEFMALRSERSPQLDVETRQTHKAKGDLEL